MKKEKPKLQKLNLNRETLRRLIDGELRPVGGGYIEESYPFSACPRQC